MTWLLLRFLTHGHGLGQDRRHERDEEEDDPPAVPGQGLSESRVVERFRRVLDKQLLVAFGNGEVKVHGQAAEGGDGELGGGDVNLFAVELACNEESERG